MQSQHGRLGTGVPGQSNSGENLDLVLTLLLIMDMQMKGLRPVKDGVFRHWQRHHLVPVIEKMWFGLILKTDFRYTKLTLYHNFVCLFATFPLLIH